MADERFALRCVWSCLALLGATRGGLSQEPYGALVGVVRDESGGVLPGATVAITHQATGRVVSLLTDRSGRYRAIHLEPGRYTVRCGRAGFTADETRDVLLLLGRTLEVDATLRVEGLAEAVRVAPKPPPLVDMRTPTVAHDVAEEEFDRLPKTRSFQSLALTAPSVNAGEIEGGFQINGASGAENAFTLDGVVTNSLIHGRSRQDSAFEYLQEVQVKTAGIPAEYGGALGGVVSAVTRSGGRAWHGEGHYAYEGSATRALPVKRLVLSPVDERTVSTVQDGRQPDDRHEIGGSLGGPLVQDRLFAFVSLSPRFVRRANTYGFANGAERGEIRQRQTLTQAFSKLGYSGRRVSAFGSVLHTPTRSTGTLPAYDGAGEDLLTSSRAGNAANLSRGFAIDATSATVSVDVVLSSASFLTLRGGLFRDRYRDEGVPDTTSVTYQTSSLGLAGVPADAQGPAGTQNTPRAIVTRDETRRTFVGADYSRVFRAGGSHTLKGGIGLVRTLNDVDSAYPGGYVFVYWDRSFSFAGTTGRGAYGYYEVHDRGTRGVARADMVSLFVQDQWAVGRRLTLNLGVRTETENIPTFRPDLRKYALRFGLRDKIAPRLGATWDLTGEGRVKVFGSWGRYYDWTKYELARDALGADFWTTRYRALDTPDVASLSLGSMPGEDLWIVPGSYRDQRVPDFDRVDPLTRPTYQDSTSAGVECRLGAASVLSVHYVHNDLKQVIDDVGTVVGGNALLYVADPGRGGAARMATTGKTAPFATPKPKRIYDAIELAIGHRLSRGWFGRASYTWSRLYGNYGGLASSDEIRTPTTGAGYKAHQQQGGSIANPGGSVNNYWNIDEVMFDSRGRLDVLGRLATDRPHVVKLYGAFSFPFGARVGLFFYGGSGTPISTYVNTTHQTEVFVNGRGDMGRTPSLTQTDLLLSQDFSLKGHVKLRVEVNVLNVLDQKTPRHLFNWRNRGAGTARASSAIDLGRTDLARGYDYDALIRATPDGTNAYDPRYGRADLFNDGTQGRLTIRLLF
jgi:hypothetical protein